MAKLALLLEYNGANYHGFQVQLGGTKTIQGSLEEALSKFATQEITITTAGRTDTGVHALNQVVHFYTTAKRNLYGWVSGVNTFLPPDIRVKQAIMVPETFDARFSALSRTYHYYLLNQAVKPAILNGIIGWYPSILNLAKMQEAANYLLGKIDFSSFRASGCQANSAVRNMRSVNIIKAGSTFRFEFTADAFVYHMVRNIVGALIYVGSGRISVNQFAHLLELKNRLKAPPTFMPDGLYLVNIEYPEKLFTATDSDAWLSYPGLKLG